MSPCSCHNEFLTKCVVNWRLKGVRSRIFGYELAKDGHESSWSYKLPCRNNSDHYLFMGFEFSSILRILRNAFCITHNK